MSSFSEERLDIGYDYGAVGGPLFSTLIVPLKSGHEQRNQNWKNGRGSWQIGERNLDKKELDYLLAFFRARRGRAQGFRFKDWSGWKVTDEPLNPTGASTCQLTKSYTSGADTDVRDIKKPVAGTVQLKRAGSPMGASIDTTTGIVTFTPDLSVAISGITQANPGQVTATGHGFATGDMIALSAIVGMTELNAQVVNITVVDADHFTIGVDTTAYTAYVSGGLAEKYIQPAETLTWSGEFDVPVRFDSDKFDSRFEAWESDDRVIFYLFSLPVVEDLQA